MIVKAKSPSGPAKIHSDDSKHALRLVHYLRTIGYEAWIEDTNGNENRGSCPKELDQGRRLRAHKAIRRAAAPAASSASAYRSQAARWVACSSRVMLGEIAGLPFLMNAP